MTQACDMEGSMCKRYDSAEFLVGTRKWTPGLAGSMSDFLSLRKYGGGGVGEGEKSLNTEP